MKLSVLPKLVENLIWIPVIPFCKIFIASYIFDALLCRDWRFLSPNRVTLQTTLINNKIYKVAYLKLTSKTFLQFVYNVHTD
jgi:hypothetical protein